MSASNDRLSRWLHFVEEGFWEHDIKSGEFWCSDTLNSLLYVDRSQPLASFEMFIECIHSEDRACVLDYMDELKLNDGSIQSMPIRIKGSRNDTYSTCSLRIGKTPEGDRIMGALRILPDERPSLQDSNVTNKTVHAILDNTSAIIFVKDREGHYLYINKEFQTLFNVNDGIIGKTDYDVFPKEAADKFAEADRKVFEAGHVVELVEQAPLNDEVRTYISTKVPLYNEQNEMYAVAGIATDITSEQKAKEELQRIADMKTQFLANITHEIRTPMNGVLLSAELLEQSALRDPQKELVVTIRQSTQSLLHIVNAILDFSKLEADNPVIAKKQFVLSDLLTSVFNIHHQASQAKQIDLNITIDTELDEVYIGDRMRLAQILNNLLGNSVKFTESAGEVRFEVRKLFSLDKHDVIQFVVDDTGIGIEPEIEVDVFKPFVQGDPSNSRFFGGTGLGLTICTRLVELLHGQISLVKKSEKGTRFEVSVPFQRVLGEPTICREQDGDEHEFVPVQKNATILLVEDNEVNRRVTRKALEEYVDRIECAENGRIACEMVEKNSYDLILMDIQMPDVDGIEATRVIRAMESMKEVPIIALTAHVMKGYRDSLQLKGFTDYISKPVSRTHLLRVVQKWLV